jgi:hypothetical protein
MFHRGTWKHNIHAELRITSPQSQPRGWRVWNSRVLVELSYGLRDTSTGGAAWANRKNALIILIGLLIFARMHPIKEPIAF